MQKVYIIKYISYYKNADPFDPVVEIYDDLFFEYYTDAAEYAKNHINKNDFVEITELNLGGK